MLPTSLRFEFRAHREFFDESRWVNLPGSKTKPLLRALSFRVQKDETRLKNNEDGLRWAIVVSKKVGNAVQRAKIKRLLRHALIALSHTQPKSFTPPYNVVIFVRSSITTQQEAEQVIKTFLSVL